MINFIICEDNVNVREIYEKIISKIAMPYDFNYKVHSFEKYNVKLKNIIEKTNDIKIYILDLELPNKNGIEIARKIREKDWDSTIIILTSHEELELRLLKEKLLILDFISKFENYEKRLIETINLVLKKINNKKLISFRSNKELYHIKLDNILYVCKEIESEKIKLVTDDEEFIIRDSLTNLIKTLDNRFIQTHRACYVNKERVKLVDFKNNNIIFDNEKSVDYLSRNYKKGLKEVL